VSNSDLHLFWISDLLEMRRKFGGSHLGDDLRFSKADFVFGRSWMTLGRKLEL